AMKNTKSPWRPAGQVAEECFGKPDLVGPSLREAGSELRSVAGSPLDENEPEALAALAVQPPLRLVRLFTHLQRQRGASPLTLAPVHDHSDLGHPVQQPHEEGKGSGSFAADHERGRAAELLAHRARLADPMGQGGVREWLLGPQVPLAPRADRYHTRLVVLVGDCFRMLARVV